VKNYKPETAFFSLFFSFFKKKQYYFWESCGTQHELQYRLSFGEIWRGFEKQVRLKVKYSRYIPG